MCGARTAIERSNLAAFRMWKHTMTSIGLSAERQDLRKQRTTDLLEAAGQAAMNHDFREHHCSSTCAKGNGRL